MRKLAILGAFLLLSLPGLCQQDTTNRFVTIEQLTKLRTYVGTLPYEQANPLVQWCNVVYQQTLKVAEQPKKETKQTKDHSK